MNEYLIKRSAVLYARECSKHNRFPGWANHKLSPDEEIIFADALELDTVEDLRLYIKYFKEEYYEKIKKN